jgi:hypothetical protein
MKESQVVKIYKSDRGFEVHNLITHLKVRTHSSLQDALDHAGFICGFYGEKVKDYSSISVARKQELFGWLDYNALSEDDVLTCVSPE